MTDASLQSLELRFDKILSQISSLQTKFQKIQESAKQVPNINTAGANASAAASQKKSVKIPSNPKDDKSVKRCKKACEDLGMESAKFHYVPSDYYDRNLTERKKLLNAPSNHHLCKSIILENTHCTRKDCKDPNNSRYYMVMLQYTRKLNAAELTKFIRDLNEGIGKKKFVFRLAEEEDSFKLSGFAHNAVTPFGMLQHVPIVLDESITKLKPETFWLGGGHVDVKLEIDTEEFIEAFDPLIANVTDPDPSA